MRAQVTRGRWSCTYICVRSEGIFLYLPRSCPPPPCYSKVLELYPTLPRTIPRSPSAAIHSAPSPHRGSASRPPCACVVNLGCTFGR